MAMCEDCDNIETHVRGKKGHANLVESHKTGYRPFAQAGVVVTHYVCSQCGTKWQYENDKNDNHAGWSLDA